MSGTRARHPGAQRLSHTAAAVSNAWNGGADRSDIADTAWAVWRPARAGA